MSDSLFGAILILSSLPGLFIFGKTYVRRRESESSIWLLLLIISSILWTVTYALFYLLPKGSLAIFFIDLRYSFVMLSSWFVFLLVYGTLNHQMFEKRTLMIFALIPLINSIFVLTNHKLHLFIDYGGFIVVNGMRALAETNGPGFFFHCIFSYFPLVYGAGIIVRRLLLVPPKYKTMLGLLFGAMLVIFAMTLLAVLGLLPYPIDLAPLAIQATLAAFYYTLFHSKSMDLMFISRDIIFENASSIILILETDGTVVDYNQRAFDIAERIQITDLIGTHGDTFIRQWQQSSQYHIFEEDPSVFSIVENETDYHYQILVNELVGRKGRIVGSYMEIKNISPIMTLIHMLQDAAYYDNLTGLPNRNYFQKRIVDVDKPEFLPICVIVGDVNGLKTVNDAYGHVKGDILLRLISTILLQGAPDGALLYRMGGDEFVGIFPCTTAEQADAYIRKTEERIGAMDDPELQAASIALGYKIKVDAGENIDDLIKAADYEMYVTKRNRRGSAR